MEEALLHFDQQLFQLINGQWHFDWLDALMPYWRSKYFWLPLYLFLFSFLYSNFGQRSHYFLLSMLLMLLLSDGLSSQLIKKSVARQRPCHEPALQAELHLLVPCGGGYSFTSSHATNHFAIAFFLALTLGRRFHWIWPSGLLWASSIAYGQVYVGVHYPLDVLGGALLGGTIGIGCAMAYHRFVPKTIHFRQV